jgi:anaerobic magnesium-protoporphyrin IX monomethyl ester cyclase
MRILLVNPASDNAFSKVGFIVPPLGLAYVASSLRDAGHDVAIHDFNVEPPRPDYGSYDLVGISGDTFRHKKVLAIAAEAKSAGAKVAVGGPHATFLDEETLSGSVVDFVVRGEGEITAAELAGALDKGIALHSVTGISFKEYGNVVRTPDRQPPQELDLLPPPARDLLKMDRYRSLQMAKRTMTSIISSRGCPSGCSFCASHHYAGKKWRARSVESLMDEIRLVVGNYGYDGVAFVDDNFTLDPRRVVGLSKAIIDEGIDIKWWCFSRTDTIVRNPEMVSWMGKSGCRYVFMGIESANQSTLDSFSKKTSKEQASRAVRTLKDNGIETLAAYILGAPDETREMVEETIKFSIKLDTGGVQYTLLTPYPGTQLFKEMKDRLLTDDWELFDCTHPVLRSDHLTPDELRGLLFKAYKSFYIRPKRLLISLLSTIRGRGVKIREVKKLIENFRKDKPATF